MTGASPQIAPCCFRGQEIGGSETDPTYLTVGARSEVTSTWWRHLACFEARLPDMPKPWNVYARDDDGSQGGVIGGT